MQAQRARRLISNDFSNVFFHRKGVDMLLAPTLIGDAIKYSEFKEYDNIARTQEQDVCTQAVNLAGTCMSPQHDRFLCICCYFFLLFNSLYAKI